MRCTKCGKEIANDSNFCEFCGTKLATPRFQLLRQCSLWQKVIITLLVIWLVFASVFFADTLNDLYYSYNYSYWVGWSGISILCTVVLIVVILWKVSMDNQSFTLRPSDGKKPGVLFTFMGIGQMILGAFKFRKTEDTYVSYTFFFVLFPLFPTGCYRVKLLKSEVGLFNKSEWNIYGSEPRNWKEIAYIYVIFYGSVVWIFSTIHTILNLI